MLERAGALIAPSGATRVEAGDYVYVIAPPEDRSHIELLFGRPEEH
jgi:NhaP-type Na+/H+ and K+/H+ antiporter